MLAYDKVEALSPLNDEEMLKIVNLKREKLEGIFKYYREMADSLKSIEIPLTKRVSWCYDFFDDTYYLLKDRKGKKRIKFYLNMYADKFINRNGKEEIIFEDGNFYDMIDHLAEIPDEYYEEFQELKKRASNYENLLCEKISFEVKKQDEIT